MYPLCPVTKTFMDPSGRTAGPAGRIIVPGAPIIEAMARPRRQTAAAALSVLLAGMAVAQVPSPAGQMRGLITTARRTPAVGAVVVVRQEGARTPVRLGPAGDSGSFAFDGLTGGP